MLCRDEINTIILENAERRRSQSEQDQERETAAETITSVADEGEGDENGLGDDGVDNLLVEDPRAVTTSSESVESTNSTTVIETKKDPLENTDTSEPHPAETAPILPDPQSTEPVDKKTKVYLKPPMSPELMIAIAVRNLDPTKNVGASCTDIVAFISLHFPYYTDHLEECKDLVRRECGMGLGFESGKENFQMRAEINCGDRIHSYVKNNRDKISRSMLEPEFLNTIIDRFVKEDSNIPASERNVPPFNNKQLALISLLKLYKKATLEQIVIFLKFVFPALSVCGVMEEFRKDFLENIAKSKEIRAEVEKSNITFSLNEEFRSDIVSDLKQFTMERIEDVGKSLIFDQYFLFLHNFANFS